MILKTLEQFQKAIPTAVGVSNFSDLEVYCQSAELWIKQNVLGKVLYDLIADDAFSDNDLLQLSRNVIANHAYWDAIPFLDLTHTNTGFGVVNANNLAPASKKRVASLRDQCLVRRDNEIELLISFLEDHVDYHDEWKGSPTYSILTDCLIRTARELEQYGQWTGTRKDFLQLRPKLIQETMTKFEPVFSKDYIDELIEKQRDNDITGDDLKVITLLKYALGSMVNGNNEAAQKVAGDALRYIDAHLSGFATYAASSEYAARITAGYTNDIESTIFSSLF